MPMAGEVTLPHTMAHPRTSWDVRQPIALPGGVPAGTGRPPLSRPPRRDGLHAKGYIADHNGAFEKDPPE